MKKHLSRLPLILATFLLLNCSAPPRPASGPFLRTELKTGHSGNAYLIIYQNDAKMGFCTSRPIETDKNILLCIPGAFTNLDDFSIDGLYICNGQTGNKLKVNHSLGGAIRIVNGEATIFPTGKGALLTDSLLRTVEEKGGALFQQIQLVENGTAAKFKDEKLFQRRGIVIFKNGQTAIAESVKAMSLKTFADDLAGLGAKDVLYTDMGAWDEGWYKDRDGTINRMGYDRSQTSRQSNWVIFYK